MIVILVPLVAAFVATLAVRKSASDIRFEFASAWSAAISLGLAIGLVAALEMGALAVLASGGFGPGRLQTIGVNPALLMAVVFVESAVVATLAAFSIARPDKPDHPLLAKGPR
jgi:ABC-type branched-subunit amino acid transport system permease subunit